MKNIFKNSWSLLILLMTVLQIAVTSCSDDDADTAQPVITGVRVCDPAKADSLFDRSGQGQVIAIIGEHLNGILAIYINDQKVSFSTTMNTDHSVIVTVPSETKGFQLTAFNADLKDEIRIETSHGTATYPFKVLTAAPVIARIQGIYPRNAGDILKVYGTNLVSIEKMYFTDLTALALDSTEWTTVGGNHIEVSKYDIVVADHKLDPKTQNYTTDSQLAVTIPDLPYDEGSLVIECAAGTRYIAFTKTPGRPVIKSISSDMPVIGEILEIEGNEFVQVESIQMGDVVYGPDEFVVAETEAAIAIPITKVPNRGSETKITITTPGGVAEVAGFYQYECLLNDFEYDAESPVAANLSWSPDAEYLSGLPIGGSGTVAHIATTGGWWDQMVFFKHDWDNNAFTLPSYDIIPADAPADHIYLAFEVYDDNSDWNNGGSGYQGYPRLNIWWADNMNTENTADITYDNFAWDDYGAGTFKNPDGPLMQDINGEPHTGMWYRTVIPFSVLTSKDADLNVTDMPYQFGTYKDIVNHGLGVIRIMSLNQGAKPGMMNYYMDNIRVIYIK